VQPQTTLETVLDYVTDIRTLLQDVIQPYRYDDISLLTSFNVTLLDARRIRPDLFVFKHHDQVPSFKVVDNSQVEMEPSFRLPLVYGAASHAIMRDQEDVQDQRATSFNAIFTEMLTGVKPIPIAGATPGAGVRK
jgi:hypothetical protein